MVVGSNELTATKNAGELMAISIAMAMQWCTTQGTLPNRAHPGLHSKPLDSAIGQVHALYHPGSHHGQRIQIKHTKH
jgi:hypothetical protein